MTEATKAYITVMEHEPAGVWTSTWYSITHVVHDEKHPVAFSEPFGDANEISIRLAKLKKHIKENYPNTTIELTLIKLGQKPQNVRLK